MQSPLSEEIQEGNQSGCQCPGDRLAPQPPGPRSPAAALPDPPQSTGGQQRAAGCQQAQGLSCWGGAVRGYEEQSPAPVLSPTAADQEATPWPGCLSCSPLWVVGREGPRNLAQFSLLNSRCGANVQQRARCARRGPAEGQLLTSKL